MTPPPPAKSVNHHPRSLCSLIQTQSVCRRPSDNGDSCAHTVLLGRGFFRFANVASVGEGVLGFARLHLLKGWILISLLKWYWQCTWSPLVYGLKSGNFCSEWKLWLLDPLGREGLGQTHWDEPVVKQHETMSNAAFIFFLCHANDRNLSCEFS